jgi:DNA-binding phage protein
MGRKLPIQLRQRLVDLLTRTDGLISRIKAGVKGLEDLNRLIDKRDSLQAAFGIGGQPERLTNEYERLNADIERLWAPFQRNEEDVRTMVAALKSFLPELPATRPELLAIRNDIESIPLLAAVESRFRLSVEHSLRDLERIRERLREATGHGHDRPTPAQVIDAQRQRLGLTMEALAAEADVGLKQLYAVKNRKNPTARTLRAVANALGCDPGDLI